MFDKSLILLVLNLQFHFSLINHAKLSQQLFQYYNSFCVRKIKFYQKINILMKKMRIM